MLIIHFLSPRHLDHLLHSPLNLHLAPRLLDLFLQLRSRHLPILVPKTRKLDPIHGKGVLLGLALALPGPLLLLSVASVIPAPRVPISVPAIASLVFLVILLTLFFVWSLLLVVSVAAAVAPVVVVKVALVLILRIEVLVGLVLLRGVILVLV